MTVLTDKLIDALRRLPAPDAAAIIAEARRQPEAGAPAPLWRGHKPPPPATGPVVAISTTTGEESE
jgi:hypothetical protein